MATVTTFDVLAEPTRRRILDLLLERERPVGELVKRLKLSQPTMGRRLQALEARMGAKLLERMGGGPGGSYVLTAKGAELLPLVERMVEAGQLGKKSGKGFYSY